MPRYRLRTLLILLAIGPPVLAWFWFNPFQVAFLVVIAAFQFFAFAFVYAVAWALDQKRS